jgi:hypothetical protein
MSLENTAAGSRVCRLRALGPIALVATALAMVPVARLAAHDIPRDVTVQAFVKPEGRHLHLLVRLPLKSVLDVEYPRRERDYVDLARIDQALRDTAMLWLANQVDIYEEDTLLGAPRIVSALMSIESDQSFRSYEQALAHVMGPRLADDTTIFWEQGLLDVLFEYPIVSDRSDFSIHARFDRLALKVVTALQFMPPGGVVRAYELAGDAGLVRLDPRWHQAALRFVQLGFSHILSGFDHLLFLVCLVIPLRRFRALVPVVTSFTVAHSVTLIASAYDMAPTALWFPPLIEALIATSIVYMAFENIVATAFTRRWLVAFGFGLVHGFGFSFALRETMQFAGSHLLTSLLSFNLGVELGQLLVLAVLVPVLSGAFRFVVAERIGTIILSALVAHTGWHWMLERGQVLGQFPLVWPVLGPAEMAAFLRLLMLIVAVAGLMWLAVGVLYPAIRRARLNTSVDASQGQPAQDSGLENPQLGVRP